MATMQQQQHTAHHLLLFLSIFLLAAAGVAARASSLVRSTCAAVAKSEESTPYPYCVLTLSALPSATDTRGLAAAAAELTAANVTRTIDLLNQLIDGVQGCVTTYQAMRGSVVGALDDLRAGRLRPAWSSLMAASWQPDYCVLDLLQINNNDPIDEQNQANSLLSGLASNIASLIAPAYGAPPLAR